MRTGGRWQRQEKTKKLSNGLDNCGHIEGLKDRGIVPEYLFFEELELTIQRL
jgi:hypothetical protein